MYINSISIKSFFSFTGTPASTPNSTTSVSVFPTRAISTLSTSTYASHCSSSPTLSAISTSISSSVSFTQSSLSTLPSMLSYPHPSTSHTPAIQSSSVPEMVDQVVELSKMKFDLAACASILKYFLANLQTPSCWGKENKL